VHVASKRTTQLALDCRAVHGDKDIDFINDRNAHFNKKIERAFGQHTKEIKANLERGTALPDN
jgi:pre-mRNA-splicing factor SYF2